MHVIMTSSAKQFITELTLQSLSKNAVFSDTFDERDPAVVSHIRLADAADLVLIAPTTANMIGKMAHGLADDMLSTTLLATTALGHACVYNECTYVRASCRSGKHENVGAAGRHDDRTRGRAACLRLRGQRADGRAGKHRGRGGEIFCGQGAGRARSFAGEKGRRDFRGTIERIDPVRYITNDSSGKMGFAIAEAARAMGADVRLIYGRTDVAPPAGIDAEHVQSAEEMYQAVLKHFPDSDLIIKAAAVADYRPAVAASSKIKKKGDTMTLELVKTVDILETLGKSKTHQFLIGFAAETHDVEAYAKDKLRRKHCDLIVANDVTAEGAGFRSDTNIVQVFDADGLVEKMPVMTKNEVARRLLAIAAERMSEAGNR